MFCLHALEKLISVNILAAIKTLFYNYNVPKALSTDQSNQFVAQLVIYLCVKYNVKKFFNSIYYPQGNLIAERINRAIIESFFTRKT
ncbi:hypothetical protein A0H76_680 [Hepatospora eriocheir]|uniref:Integrase catalytic domain-containing protein n=1 Tax=Hepatospora eriocheir TaxID=1081669 RepID=A0A1X0Q7D4_9MICR|nr:hypothetical protein A0H76_680 [Hepatospora eriocheir]